MKRINEASYENLQKFISEGNWEAAKKECTNQTEYDKLFNAFYKATFGNKSGYAEKIKPIDRTFRDELSSLGFNEAGNPFIYFVREFVCKYGITTENYNVIHNMYVNRVLEDSDLNAKNLLGKKNVIFNKTLYVQNVDAIEYLIKLQQWILEPYNLENTVTREEIRHHYNDKMNDPKNRYFFLYDLFYEPANMQKGLFHDGQVDFKSINGKDTRITGLHEPNAADYKEAYRGRVKDAAGIERTLAWCNVKERVDSVAGREQLRDENQSRNTDDRTYKLDISTLNINDNNAREAVTAIVSNIYPESEQAQQIVKKYGTELDVLSAIAWKNRINKAGINSKNVKQALSQIIKQYINKEANK